MKSSISNRDNKGQDMALICLNFIRKKGYRSTLRKASSYNTQYASTIYMLILTVNVIFKLHYGDLTTESTKLSNCTKEVQPDEIYNLGAMSHVRCLRRWCSEDFFGSHTLY
jgi:GDPmannose 4,6-dehydratase